MAKANWYERHILPRLIDWGCGVKVVRQQRGKLIPRARGRVLEIGIGTGLNLAHYDQARVTEVVGVDPAAQMHPKAQQRLKALTLNCRIVRVGAEGLDFADNSFDSLVCTYSLCSIENVQEALLEMARVLKPEGELLICEHGLAPEAEVRRWQNRLTGSWSRCMGGCRLNRDIPALITQAGFRFTELHNEYLRGPKPWTYHYRGVARLADQACGD